MKSRVGISPVQPAGHRAQTQPTIRVRHPSYEAVRTTRERQDVAAAPRFLDAAGFSGSEHRTMERRSCSSLAVLAEAESPIPEPWESPTGSGWRSGRSAYGGRPSIRFAAMRSRRLTARRAIAVASQRRQGPPVRGHRSCRETDRSNAAWFARPSTSPLPHPSIIRSLTSAGRRRSEGRSGLPVGRRPGPPVRKPPNEIL